MPRSLPRLLPLVCVLALAGCGGGSATAPLRAADCVTVATDTLGGVAQRVYRQAASGRNMAGTIARLTHSPALSAAVASGSAGAVKAAVAPLVQRQIVALEIRRPDGTLLYRYGRQPHVLGPGRGVLRDSAGNSVGSFTVGVLSDNAYVGLTSRLTGSAVVVRSGAAQLAGNVRDAPSSLPARGALSWRGRSYRAYSFSGEAYPSGPLRVSLLIPTPNPGLCSSDRTQVVANTLGQVARNIYAQELHSGYIAFALRAYQHYAPLLDAVRRGDRAAALRAVNTIYSHHIHVVRVQVRDARGTLLADSGVRWALAPVHGTLRSGGRMIGRIDFSEQDDLGFGTLVHRFTGAQVILRSGSTQVPGSTLSGGPASLPASGAVTYRGRTYRVVSFDARGFPAGTVRATILVPSGGATA